MSNNNYKIELGVMLNRQDLAKIKNELKGIDDNIPKITLGTDNSDFLADIRLIRDLIGELYVNQNRISLDLDIKAFNSDIDFVKEKLHDLMYFTDAMRDAIGNTGRWDSDKLSIVDSINKISASLDTAIGKFDELNAELKTLSSKDFSINLDFKMGGSNQIARNSAYGKKVRGETLPQLKQQVDALVKYYNENINKTSRQYNDIELLQSLVRGTTLNTGEFNQKLLFGDNSLNYLMSGSGGSLSNQIQAYKEFLNIFKKASDLKGLDFSSVYSQFSKSADQLEKEAVDIQTGVNEVNESFEKLKQIFGGNNLNTEELSRQLDSIVVDLGEIKTALQGLSGINLEGLTTSFDKLSDTLTELINNTKLVQDALGNGLANIGNNVSRSTGQVNKQTKKLISDAAQNSIDNVSSKVIGRAFRVSKEADSDVFQREMEGLVEQWTKSKGKLKNIDIETRTFYDKNSNANIEKLYKAHVTYNNGLDKTIKKTIEWRQIGTELNKKNKPVAIYGWVEAAGRYSKSLGQTNAQTDRFVKQQKQAVANLTNTINQLNRAANDQNAPRAIKDSSHVENLKTKYNEVISAIQRMGDASSDAFVDEQNNVKRLISEFKSLVSEYKNAENVSAKMKGTDFESGLEIAKNDLEKFKADAKDFPQITQTIRELDKAIEGVGDASSLNKFNDQLRVARSELAKVKSETSAANRTEKVGINVDGLKSDIADMQRVSAEINEFETEINGAKVSVKSLLSDLNKVNTQGDFSVVNSKLKAFVKAAKAAGIAVEDIGKSTAEVRTKLAEKIKLKFADKDFENDISKINNKFNQISNKTTELSTGVQNAKQAIREMESAIGTDDEVVDVEKLINAYEKYEHALKNVNNQLDMQARMEKNSAATQKLIDERIGFQSGIDAWLTKNSAAAKKFGAQMKDLRAQAERCDRAKLDHLRNEFKRLDSEAEAAGLKMQSFTDRIKTQFSRYRDYFSIASVFMYGSQAIRNMFEQVKLIDSAMTELKKVTDETDASYEKFLTNAASKAKEIGTTIDGLVNSTADFARLGYGFEDAQGLAEVANIYAVVGDEVEGVEGATESLISTMAAFNNEAKNISNTDFAMSIIDKYNEIGNKFAITSGGIGEALQRSASSLNAANNSMDESIALITAANTVVQNPDKVGNAFKTISMRIRGAKTELEEAGESTEGMVDSTANLRKEVLALSGVDIMLDKDNFKSTYQVMDELSQKWEDLSDIAQASIIELMAGKHQGNVFASLMQNFDIARDALEVSANSSGSAMREHEKWSKSLEAQLLKLQASWQSLSQSFLNSDFLRVVLDGVINLVDGLNKLIDTFGVLPTLVTGFTVFNSAFNNKGIFTTLNNELNGVTNKMAFFGKSFKNILRDMQSGQGVFTSFFGKTITENDIGYITDFMNQIKDGVPTGKAWANTMTSASVAGKKMAVGVKTGAISMSSLKTATIGAKASLFGLEIAATAANAALTMGISFLISAGISAIQKLANAKKDLAEKVEEITSKFKEQHDELVKNKSSFETQAKRYGELSKGINSLGENVSLTSYEYEEYQSIVNSIADKIPSLVTGYNSQGDAILDCAGNVNALTDAYKNLIIEQNNAVIKSGDDFFKDFNNDLGTLKEQYGNFTDGITKPLDVLQNVFKSSNLETAISNMSETDARRISTLLENNGFERDVLFSGKAGYETHKEFIIRAIKEDSKAVKSAMDDAFADINGHAEDLNTFVDAYFSTKFLTDYSDMSSRMQNIINQIASGFDTSFYEQFDDDKALKKYLDSMLETFDNIGHRDTATLEAVFDLKTQFNNGDISYGEYVDSIERVNSLINDLKLDDKIKSKIKLSIGLDEDGVVKEYQSLVNRLSDHTKYDFDSQITGSTAKAFLDSLSAEELSVAIDVITKLSNNGVKETVQDIRNAINREMAIKGVTFDLNLEVESAGIEALKTALSETVSAAGLSSESIKALKSRYAEFESQGYDLSSMFEETSNGIHLNRKAVGELEQAYAKQKQNDIKDDLSALKKEYDLLTEDINNCNEASERASLYVQRDAILQQINDAATLAAQYDGLTSSYNAWLSAEESGSERDMYEKIIEGFGTVSDEIKRGWLDDGTIKFLELLTGQTDLATKSGKELKKIYNSLDDTIKHTKYSISDFFTVDEDGNSTNRGVYNFLDAIGQMEEEAFGGKDVIKRDKNGRILSFDFGLVAKKDENGNIIKNGDQVIAEALGISEELVQIMLRASDDAGFVVNLDGAYTQLADLKTDAEKARITLINLKKDGLDKLKDTDVNFNLEATGDDLVKEQGKAVELLDKFKKDGKIDLSIEGAQEALDIAEYLTIRLDDLTEPRYMQVDTSTLEKDLVEPVKKMQEFERLSKKKHLLTLTGDTEELEKTEAQMNEIAKYLDGIKDEDIQVKLGIKDLDDKEIKEKLEKGEIELDAELNIDVQMSDDLKDMRLMMMNQLGLASDNEVKLKISYDIDDSIVNKLTEEEKEVVVKYIADHKEIDDWSPEAKDAFVKYLVDGGDPEKFDPEDKDSWVVYDTDTTKPDNYNPDKEGTVTFNKDTSAIDNWKPVVTGIAKFVANLVLPDGFKSALSSVGKFFGIGSVNGTANVNGTTGRAFKQGSWGTKNSGTALVGELGTETLVRDGHYYTIGNSGAEFIKYKKGDIIFNHKQTEELFKYGKVTSGGGRAKAFVSGTAFSDGYGGLEPSSGSSAYNNKKNNSSSKSSSYSSSKDEFEETIDWIEIAIDRIERAIDKLDQKANNIYKTWSERNKNLVSEISRVEDEIELQQKAYNRYIQEANSVGLSSSWATKVRNGTIDISTIKDEKLAEKIKDYQTWYEKALDCEKAIEDLKEKEAALYKQRFDNAAAKYDGVLGVIEHEKNMIEEGISQSEAKGWLVSGEYYKGLANNEKNNISELEKKKADMLAELQTAMESGTIAKGSEAWYQMVNDIDAVTLEIEKGETKLLEYEKTIRELEWEQFDLLQEKISAVTEESNFLIDLLSNEKLYDDNGQLTDAGMATMGLHGQNYNTHMYQADKYAEEIANLDKEIAKDPYNQDLINRRKELVKLQQDSILAAEDEKEAIRNMVQEGIEIELDALQERIDKYNEALQSQKDLYDYQKKVKKQTEEIASLEKQMAAYAGDTSEEAKAKVQEIKLSLEEAKENLKETEYEKYISDQQQLLDELYTEYEEILNTRLDNINALLGDMITEINSNASTISTTISDKADSVGYTLSDSMKTIWSENSNGTNNVITTYGDKFTSAQTTTNNALNTINTNLQSMITQLNKLAKTNVKSASTSSAANSKEANTGKKPDDKKDEKDKKDDKTPTPTIKVGGKINAGSAKIYDYAGDKSGERQYYRNDPIYTVLGEKNGYLKVRYHKLKSGTTGWFKKSDVKAYATGKKDILDSELAWTQEEGTEFIVRPSDGAILTPIAKSDSVLNAQASNNIWNMANNPSEFIKDNLNLGTTIPSGSNVQNNYTQTIGNVVFDMKNVKNYEEMLHALKDDRRFEKLITAMTIDRINGKSSLAKGKSIR